MFTLMFIKRDHFLDRYLFKNWISLVHFLISKCIKSEHLHERTTLGISGGMVLKITPGC